MKQTFGEKVLDNLNKNNHYEGTPEDYRRWMEPDLVKNLHDAVEDALTYPEYKDKDFYLQVFSKREPATRMPYTRVFVRHTCPHAACTEAVYKYHHDSCSLEFFWQIPDLKLYLAVLSNPDYYLKSEKYKLLARAVILMKKGVLNDWADKENGYKKEGFILKKKEEE